VIVRRDDFGNVHVVGLSGGHDSTAMSLELRERHPEIPFNFVCTPTGNESAAMFAHWRNLGDLLGSRLIPVVAGTLKAMIREEKMLPNFRARWCTRRLKIEPYREWLKEQTIFGATISYIGLRADEEGRAGGAYDDIFGVEMRFPLREWGWGEEEVQAKLVRASVVCPDRTDCEWCYHQRIGEWWELWFYNRESFMEAIAIEQELGYTFRTQGRDSWPTSLAELHEVFSTGKMPTISLNKMSRERMTSGGCRVCTL